MKTVKSKSIVLVGAGNVAWHLAQAFTAAGHQVVKVYSRSGTSGEELTNLLPFASPTTSLDFRNTAADIVLVAIPDSALITVLEQLKVTPETIVAHTSGSQPLTVLSEIKGARVGVFYPLQTFSKAKPVEILHVPILIEADSKEVQLELEELALSISSQVQQIDSEARKQLHLAAVFACNFTNHLLGISQQILQESGLPKELLHPLIKETIAKAMHQDPYSVQTGPAIRRDDNVLQAHVQMLQQHPTFQALYQALTNSIQESDQK
ncbi:Rossmann-like and DUF2520 domain-containing protein [Pontibacter locisalis]|uniref:Rossmann-like and DUF2520 domain-containing protein n=1 Tax=Pontibacter locisalis TaxID=1719035 RepID=A0ABW5IHU4_9BACT